MNLKASIAALPNKGSYVAAWRRLATLPDHAQVSTDWTGGRPVAMVRLEFARALDARINARGGLDAANEEVDIELKRDARDLEAILKHRVRVYRFRTDAMNRRFGHLLASRDD